MVGADVFFGLSAKGAVTPEMVKAMADKPIIFAMANPDPEITAEEVAEVRDDAIMATGRSDYPNQVNNVLCFPFIFRGALDAGATTITEEMKLAATKAIAELAQAEQSDLVAIAYGQATEAFGPEYLIPRPFDPRLIVKIAPAVAQAAMDSGVATRPIADLEAYRQQLTHFVYHSGLIMKPVFSAAKANPRRVVYCEGEDERVLHAVQVVVDEQLARPIVIGRPEVIEMRLQKLGLRMRASVDFELVNPNNDPRFRDYWQLYYELMQRKGVSVEVAKREVIRRTTLIGALMVRQNEADAMICGTYGEHSTHLSYIAHVIGLKPGVKQYAAMNLLLLQDRTIFICDTYVNPDPTPEQLAEITLLAAEEVARFGLAPKIALLSHSSFGSARTPSAQKMSRVRDLLEEMAPQLEVEGEMHGDAALSEEIRRHIFPNSRLQGEANLLIMPTLDAANISFNLLKVVAGEGITVGPILLGTARACHIVTPTTTSRRLVNMTALAVVEAAAR
jgi:malate dehydrogenase (oxaloacetate-decarboxylating)(NADP+)